MEISFVSYSNGPICFNDRDLVKDLYKKKELFFEYFPNIRFSRENDFIGLQLDIDCKDKKESVGHIGFLIGVEIKGWTEKIKEIEDLKKGKDLLEPLCLYLIKETQGIVAARTADLLGFPLLFPPIPINDFIEKTLITDSTPKKS